MRLKKVFATLEDIYRECYAGRQISQEALEYIRRRESYLRMTDPAYDEFGAYAATPADLEDSLAELNEALGALQRAVGVNKCAQYALDEVGPSDLGPCSIACELGHEGDPFNE